MLKASIVATLAAGSAAETVLGVYPVPQTWRPYSKNHPTDSTNGPGIPRGAHVWCVLSETDTSRRTRHFSSPASAMTWSSCLRSKSLRQSDNVLQSSANGFVQGLYPPVGASVAAQTLRNGSIIQAPMNGYQIIPINIVSSGTGSEDSGWLQASTSCYNAETSSNNYFYSSTYDALLKKTQTFYTDLSPVISGSFNASSTSFKNAYTIFDYVNVAEIHNKTIPSANLLTNQTLFQLRTLADTHEFNLAYNKSEPVRAIAGAQLAGQVVEFFNDSIVDNASSKIGVQYGETSFHNRTKRLTGLDLAPMAVFRGFFGLADLTATGTNDQFYGIFLLNADKIMNLTLLFQVSAITPA